MRKVTREPNGVVHKDEPPAPEVMQERKARLDRAADMALIVLLVIAVIGSLSLARTVLVPVVSAVVIGLMLGPVISRATRIGIPSVLTATVLLLAVVVVFNALILLMTAPAIEWIGKAPEIGQTLKDKAHILDRPLAAFDELRKTFTPAQQGDTMQVSVVNSGLIQPVVSFLTPALGQLLIFFGTLFFFVAARPHLRQSLVSKLEGRSKRLRALRAINDVETTLTSYLSVVAVINLVVGVFATLITYLIGLPSPPAWGVLGFVLNFIPYVGPLIVEVSLFAVGLITFPTLGYAVIAPAAFLGFTILEGHFITPTIIGRRFTTSPLLVFLSLVFWAWIWGPVGALLAVPLLIVMIVAMGHLFPKDEPSIP